MRDNVKEKCRKLRVSEELTREIQEDVFGMRSGELRLGRFSSTRTFGLHGSNFKLFLAGLVDSAFDECDFFLLESKWEAHSPEGKQFAEYFRKHKLPDVKRTMLLGQRVASGLRLDVYTQNASECTNRLIKRGMDIKSMSVLEVAEFLRDMSREQERNSELACFKETNGVYLHDSYLHLKVSEDQMYGSTKPITQTREEAF